MLTSPATNAAEVTQWASITTPIIVANAYIARSSIWNMVTTTGQSDHFSFGTTTLGDTSHPIFNGVTPTATGFNGEPSYTWTGASLSWVTSTAVTGQGQLLGVRNNSGNQWVSLATWNGGTTMGTNTLAERRFYFPLPSNYSDLNTTGQQMLLNLSIALAPEPARALLVALGLTALLSRRRR